VAAVGHWAILRRSWLVSRHGAHFLKTMLRLSETRYALSVVDDQIGGPTPADGIAAACLSMLHQIRADHAKGGLHHFAGQPNTSWKGFAEAIFARARRAVAVTGITSSAYPTPAWHQLNSRMDCTELLPKSWTVFWLI
jgi:dTDP-4-dehydrorhamnose reductase